MIILNALQYLLMLPFQNIVVEICWLSFIPIVIGVLGSFTPNLPKNLETLLGVHKIGT